MVTFPLGRLRRRELLHWLKTQLPCCAYINAGRYAHAAFSLFLLPHHFDNDLNTFQPVSTADAVVVFCNCTQGLVFLLSGGQLICKFIAAVVVKMGGVHIKDQSHIQVCPALEAAGGEPLIQVHGTASKSMPPLLFRMRRKQNFSPAPWAVRPRVPSARFVFGVNACSLNAPFSACIEDFSRLLSAFSVRPFFLPSSFARSFSLCILVGEFLGQNKKRGYLVPIYLRQKSSHSGHPFHAPPLRAVRTPTNKKQASNWVWLPPFLDWTACFEISVRMRILRSFSVTANMVSA